jgi:hypothetical protein
MLHGAGATLLSLGWEQEQERVEKVGMLLKQGRNFKTWKERKFVLQSGPGMLQYKENEKFKGGIELECESSVTVSTISGLFRRQWAFKVDNGEEKLVMAAKSELEMLAWITAIELVSVKTPSEAPVKSSTKIAAVASLEKSGRESPVSTADVSCHSPIDKTLSEKPTQTDTPDSTCDASLGAGQMLMNLGWDSEVEEEVIEEKHPRKPFVPFVPWQSSVQLEEESLDIENSRSTCASGGCLSGCCGRF